MLINVEKENLVVKSKITKREYQVYKINIEDNKITDYLICNLGVMELWDSKRFYPLENISCCLCCQLNNCKRRI